MSKEALAKVVQRAISDAAFRRQLNSDPTGALRGFDLSGDDWKFAGRVAPDSTGTVRTGDDWKFADRQTADGASGRVGDDWKFADKSAGGNMANYPAHDGLAGPSEVSSVRAGDDWKFADS